MAVAKVIEISSTSYVSFDDAIRTGIERANKTLNKVKSVWIKEMHVRVEDDGKLEYQVNMMLTFVLEK